MLISTAGVFAKAPDNLNDCDFACAKGRRIAPAQREIVAASVRGIKFSGGNAGGGRQRAY